MAVAEEIKARSHRTMLSFLIAALLYHQPIRYHQVHRGSVDPIAITVDPTIKSIIRQTIIINSTITIMVVVFNIIDQAQVA
jgi:hypothetical protein